MGVVDVLRRLAWVTGLAIMATSLSLLAAGIYGLIRYDFGYSYEQWPGTVMFLSGLLFIVVGWILYNVGRGATIRQKEAILTTVLLWLLIPLLAALPFKIAAGIPYIDAAFESVSGWTTTGLTILTGEPSSWHGVYVPSVDEVPDTIKIWRTLMQWEGGLGIVILTIAILAPPGVSAAVLYLAEGKFERLEASFKRTAVLMAVIYLILTGIGILLFVSAGTSVYDAVNHAMTGIATAGFSPHSSSLGYYMDKPGVLFAGMIVMFLGAVSFSDHYNMLRGNFSQVFTSIELRAQLSIIALSILFSVMAWKLYSSFHNSYSLLQVVFHVVSAFATAGFQAGNLHSTPEAYKLLLAVLSIIGGSAFSTAGGIKVLRLIIAAKAISMESDLLTHPPGYVPRRTVGKYFLDETLVRRTLATVAAFIGAYTLLVMTLALVAPQYDLGDIIFEVASAMGNVGLSTGISAASAAVSVKLILIAAMLLGRLEVITYLVVIRMLYSKK
ncbi:MAG: TrkH family potassium uptake protein [Desulfurococcales archaeon]|nr:TrkH family potassium uptake protein [Desulfurococcales archaeon]